MKIAFLISFERITANGVSPPCLRNLSCLYLLKKLARWWDVFSGFGVSHKGFVQDGSVPHLCNSSRNVLSICLLAIFGAYSHARPYFLQEITTAIRGSYKSKLAPRVFCPLTLQAGLTSAYVGAAIRITLWVASACYAPWDDYWWLLEHLYWRECPSLSGCCEDVSGRLLGFY